MCRLLLDSGADPDKPDLKGTTPLAVASDAWSLQGLGFGFRAQGGYILLVSSKGSEFRLQGSTRAFRVKSQGSSSVCRCMRLTWWLKV